MKNESGDLIALRKSWEKSLLDFARAHPDEFASYACTNTLPTSFVSLLDNTTKLALAKKLCILTQVAVTHLPQLGIVKSHIPNFHFWKVPYLLPSIGGEFVDREHFKNRFKNALVLDPQQSHVVVDSQDVRSLSKKKKKNLKKLILF